MKYLNLKRREIPVMSRMIVAVGLALGLLSLFQNCSQVNFAADSKTLVQGAVTSTATTPTTPTTPATPVVSATPAPNVGICVLTCANTSSDDEHEFSQNASCKAPPSCELEEDGSGMPVKSIVQTVSNSESLPKTVCVSKQACQMIASNLSSGKLVLMKTTNNKVSTLKGTSFEPITSSDDCQDTLSDDEVKSQFAPAS